MIEIGWAKLTMEIVKIGKELGDMKKAIIYH